jgi:hypothetical protein
VANRGGTERAGYQYTENVNGRRDVPSVLFNQAEL